MGKKTDKRVEKAKREIDEIFDGILDGTYIDDEGFILFLRMKRDLYKVVERLAESSK